MENQNIEDNSLKTLQDYLNEHYPKDSVQYKAMKLLIWQSQQTSVLLGYLQCLSFTAKKFDELHNTRLKQEVESMSMAVSPSLDTMFSIGFCDEQLSNLLQTSEDMQYIYEYFACVGIRAQTENFYSLKEKYLQSILSIKS